MDNDIEQPDTDRSSEARLNAIVQSAMDAIITVDREQRVVLFNAAAEAMFGCAAADAIGGPLERFIPARFRELHRHHIEHFGRTGATSRRMGQQRPLWARRVDGSEFPIEASISQAHADGQLLLTVILRDITERFRAEERLQEAHARVREGEARLDAVVRSAMDAIIAVDAAQRIVLFNAAAEKMFGLTADAAVGLPLDRLIPARFRARHHQHIEHFLHTGETARRMGVQMALWALHTDGTEFPIEAAISRATVAGQVLLTVILRDITERLRSEREIRRSQQELREGEERLEAIVRSAMDAIITVDHEQRVILFNAAAEQMFRRDAEHVIGGYLEQLLPARFRAVHHAHVERFMHTGETARRMGQQMALWGLRGDGSEFPIEASISHATVAGQPLMTVILRDITERLQAERQIVRAHDELRTLSAAMLEVREAERTRIARELHDELGQALTALKMDVDLLHAMLPADRADLRQRTVEMRGLLDTTVATTRRISADLRPLVLDDLGLDAAAEWLVQNVAQRAGLACALYIDPACADLGEPYASALFRIMQECLTNVVKHARASAVQIRLERSGASALLSVRDDGIGITRDRRNQTDSFGLRGMTERVLVLDGQIDISSRPGAGTTVVVRIPLSAPAAEERV